MYHKDIHNTLIMLPHYRGKFGKSKMILESITASKLGVTDLIFVDPGMKVYICQSYDKKSSVLFF